MAMGKIRHIAIKSRDPGRLAAFYKTTFGMKEVSRLAPKEGSRSIYLSDGYINLAILPSSDGEEGIDHFGFQVENAEEVSRTAEIAGAAQGLEPKPRDGRFAEFNILDPVGTKVDLSEQGWRT
jgi:catechol 2,3-dioxygenase-like lactoylglutathione lyase family enzyme